MSDNLIIDCGTGKATTQPVSPADQAAAAKAEQEAKDAQARTDAANQARQAALTQIANLKDNQDPNVSALAHAVHTLLGS